MYRLSALMLCLALWGCGDPGAAAPRLTLKVAGASGSPNTVGRYQITRTGLLSESGDSGGGRTVVRRVIVEKIADGGVTLTYEVTDSAGDDVARTFVVPYGQETKVELSEGTTLIASLDIRR